MELLDRYLNAVRFWLPQDQKRDIVAELSEDIHSEIDEQERDLGRPLSSDELQAMLKRRGDPLTVAQRYLPQRYLIGPKLFPVYALILNRFFAYFVGPWLLVWLGFVVFAPNYRLEHPGWQLVTTLGSIWTIAINCTIGLTVGFAILERYQHKLWPGRDWDPRSLPPVRDAAEIRRSSSIGELVWTIFVILWWRDVLPMAGTSALHAASSPIVAHYFYWPILLVLFTVAFLAGVLAIKPCWTRAMSPWRLVVDLAALAISIALATIVLRGGTLVTVTSSKLTVDAAAALERWLNWSWFTIVVLSALTYLTRAYQDYRRATGKVPSTSRVVKLMTGEC